MSEQTSAELSVLEYLYRDGGNFKTYGAVVLRGYQAEAESVILGCLDWGGSLLPSRWASPRCVARIGSRWVRGLRNWITPITRCCGCAAPVCRSGT